MKKFKEILFLKSLKRVGKATIYGKYWDLLNNYELPDLIIKVGQANPKFSKEDLQKAKENAERIYNDAVNNPEMEVITVLDENYPKKLGMAPTTKKLFQEINVEKEVILNFKNIKFISRSFAQEYVFQKHNTNTTIDEINMDDSIKQLLEIVEEDFEKTCL